MIRSSCLLLLALLAVSALAEAQSLKRRASALLKDAKSYDPRDTEIDPAERDREASAVGGGKNERVWRAETRILLRALEKHGIEHKETVAALASEDDLASTKALCEIYAALETRSEWIHEQRDAMYRQLAGVFNAGSDPLSPKPTYNAKDKPLVDRLSRDRAVLRGLSDHYQELQIECIRGLKAREAGDSLRYLETALVKSKHPLVRARVARILGQRKSVSPEVLVKALKRERDAGVRAGIVTMIGTMGERAHPYLPELIKWLEDPSERVRVAAARALAALHTPECVEPLIQTIGNETGAARAAFARALESLTGEKLGTHADLWAKYWKDHELLIKQKGLPKPGADAKGERAGKWKNKGGYFFGIPQESHRIIYVIDISGSMGKHKVGDQTRLKACQKELSRAIDALPKVASFAILVYNRDAKAWEKKMTIASPDNKGKAKKFVNKFQAAQNTNIYDALRIAFKMAGRGTTKKSKQLNADTIYLLTDGSPTKPDGSVDSTKKILEAARKWNELGRVTIHTIGIGTNLNTGFLQQLASDHNGEFIHKKK